MMEALKQSVVNLMCWILKRQVLPCALEDPMQLPIKKYSICKLVMHLDITSKTPDYKTNKCPETFNG